MDCNLDFNTAQHNGFSNLYLSNRTLRVKCLEGIFPTCTYAIKLLFSNKEIQWNPALRPPCLYNHLVIIVNDYILLTQT